MRNIGLSWDVFVSELTAAENNIVVDLLTEFGHSMGICIILLKTKVTYPYGNSFLLSIPTILSTGLYNGIFDADVVQLNTWFPDYLGLNYGTDFSIIGEAVLNYGAYVAPIVLLVEGIIIGKISTLFYKKNKSPLSMCLCLSVMTRIIKLPRSSVWYVLNGIVYVIIIFAFVYFVVAKYFEIRGEKRLIIKSR